MVLEDLRCVLDELVALDPAALGDGETLVALHREFNRLQAVVTAATGAFEASGDWHLDRARTAAHWIMTKTRLPKATVKAEVSLARSLRYLPHTEEAWREGEIGLPHVHTLARARRPGTEDQMVEDEAMLVAEAKKLQFRQFSKIVDYWADQSDADGAERTAERQHDDRRLHLSQSYDNMWFLDATLDPVVGRVVNDEITRLADEMFKAEWAAARTRLGHDPTAADLERTPQQRRADALLEMAIRSRTAPKDGRRPAPLFTVLVGWETFHGRICELASGTVVTPGTLVPWLASAWIERIVFQSRSRVLDVGVERRLFVGATRRAVEVRDQECYHPTCDAAAPDCEVDHILPSAADGPTIQSNGRLACGFHNRARPNSQPP